MAPTLSAGVAVSTITPPIGVNLAGFAARDHGAEGIHDDLRCKALVLDVGDAPVCLITNDLIGIGLEQAAGIRAGVEQATGIPAARVLVNASHTHSGPALRAAGGVFRPAEAYARLLDRTIIGTAKMAADARRPAWLAYARVPVQVGINRREWVDGRVLLGRNPEGPIAPYVDVARLTSEAGEPLAILFSHAAHPVVMGPDSYLISADYPGAAQALIERLYPGAVALFAQGCSGNINADPRGTFEVVSRLGMVLGAAAVRGVEEAEPLEVDVLGVASEPFELPLAEPPPLAEAEARLAEQQKLWDEAQAAGDEQRARLRKPLVAWAERVAKLAREGVTAPTTPFPLQALRIGELAIIGLPGEVFVEYQLNLDAASPFAHTIVLGYTNGVQCYLPTEAAIPEGGYEVVESIQYFGATQVSPRAEQALLVAGSDLLQRLRKAVD